MADLAVQVDNVDYCSACGGSGRLLCCDGCIRSFHFKCLDPPVNSEPEGTWLCFVCQAKRDPQPRPLPGLFSGLRYILHKQNPRAFHLPTDLRNYFHNVVTGEEGEFEEDSIIRPK